MRIPHLLNMTRGSMIEPCYSFVTPIPDICVVASTIKRMQLISVTDGRSAIASPPVDTSRLHLYLRSMRIGSWFQSMHGLLSVLSDIQGLIPFTSSIKWLGKRALGPTVSTAYPATSSPSFSNTLDFQVFAVASFRVSCGHAAIANILLWFGNGNQDSKKNLAKESKSRIGDF